VFYRMLAPLYQTRDGTAGGVGSRQGYVNATSGGGRGRLRCPWYWFLGVAGSLAAATPRAQRPRQRFRNGDGAPGSRGTHATGSPGSGSTRLLRPARWSQGHASAYQTAITLVGPPEPAAILGAPTKTVAPLGGIASRLARFSRPQRLVPSSVKCVAKVAEGP